MWVNQLTSKGFGDAVLTSKNYVHENNFIVQAGDVAIIPKKTNPIHDLILLKENLDVEAAFLVKKVSDPERHGIVTLKKKKSKFSIVSKVVEKPDKPESNLGIMPVYFFRRSIFDCLGKIKQGKNNEMQLTDAIQKLIEAGKNVIALDIGKSTILDVGTPKSFYDSLNFSYNSIK